ncbi:MAG: PKD domain-containing protein [Candidatus Peregrinibacteria bacterium]|nr:PKD domain-containing protein [Candidatus Peregrinibacteria bacterium]
MRKFFAVLVFLFPIMCLAQEDLNVNSEPAIVEFAEEKIIPKIAVDEFVAHGKKVLLDASTSKTVSISSYGRASFSWDFGDGTRMQWGEQIAHVYDDPGKYTVKLNIKQGKKKESVEKDIFVYDRKGILISDKISVDEVVASAGEQGIWLKEVISKEGGGFSVEEGFSQKLSEKINFLMDADILIFDAKSVEKFQSFAQFWKKLSEENRFSFDEKLLVQITESSFEQTSKLLQPIFQILRPNFILLTRPEALIPIFETKNFAEILGKLDARGIENRIIDERSRMTFFLPFSRLMTYFVINGVSQHVIYLLLAVPFLAFIISFARQFVGISTFGVYAPLMLSLSFLVLGLKFGFLVFMIVMIISSLIRFLFEKVELLYIPRVSLLLSALSLSFFLVLGIAVYFEASINLALTIFPMLVMATVSEKFLASQSEEGMLNAILATGETVAVALFGYFFVTWGVVEGAILAFPEWILIPILGNIWLGRFTGLRMTEYFKFRTLFGEDSQEEE